jgi:anti-anti-sigma factor
MLRVTMQGAGRDVILYCKGRIVRGEETDILCNALLSQEANHVTLDLAEVDVMDGCGLGLLISFQASGVYLKLLNPSKHVRDVLTLTGLDRVFEICSSEGGAVVTGENPAPEGVTDGTVECAQ